MADLLRLLDEYEIAANALIANKDLTNIAKHIAKLDEKINQARKRTQKRNALATQRANAQNKVEKKLKIAAQLQTIEYQIKEAELQALKLADEPARRLDLDQLERFAHQVSFSSMAPLPHAFDEFAKQGFRNGWGTPAPQQHMLGGVFKLG